MVTIILPVSRPDYLKQVFASLELLNCDKKQVNILAYVDGPLTLFEPARNFVINSKFNERLTVYRQHRNEPNVGSVRRRRQRIADIHNEMKKLVNPCKYVFLIEDDTLLPPSALEKLLNFYDTKTNAGLVTGMQIGRWGYDHIGAWRCNDIYDPTSIISIPKESDDQIAKIDASGLYCCLTKYENYMDHRFAPFLNILGPDVAFGIHLRQQGLQNYVDYSIKCGHMTKKETIKFDRDIIQVELKKVSEDKWSQGRL